MVLRAFQVESNGGLISLQDFHEPEDTVIYKDIVALDYTKPKFTLSQNEPNPFSDYAKIRFSISNSGDKLCEIYIHWYDKYKTIYARLSHSFASFMALNRT